MAFHNLKGSEGKNERDGRFSLRPKWFLKLAKGGWSVAPRKRARYLRGRNGWFASKIVPRIQPWFADNVWLDGRRGWIGYNWFYLTITAKVALMKTIGWHANLHTGSLQKGNATGAKSGRQRAAAAVAVNLSQPVGLHDITICTKLPGQDCPYLRTPQAYDWPTSTSLLRIIACVIPFENDASLLAGSLESLAFFFACTMQFENRPIEINLMGVRLEVDMVKRNVYLIISFFFFFSLYSLLRKKINLHREYYCILVSVLSINLLIWFLRDFSIITRRNIWYKDSLYLEMVLFVKRY